MDLRQLKINVPQNSKPSMMRSISFLWIISGIVLLLIGLWSLVLYFAIEPLKDKLILTVNEYPTNAHFVFLINLMPVIGIFLASISIFSIVTGVHFKKFKAWALSSIHILSYILIFISGGLGILWYKLWIFTIENAEKNIWNYVGMFVGIFACLVYIGILIYFIRSIKLKKFKEAYKNKISI